jgi:hypothetical protein
VIQKKRLCQFCLRHPDTQPCPSQSQPACPIRGCMRMHHKMLHRALLREEARPVVLEMAATLMRTCSPATPRTQRWSLAMKKRGESQRSLACACKWCLLRRTTLSRDFTPCMIRDLQ